MTIEANKDYTLREAAEKMGVTYGTALKYISLGKNPLKATKVSVSPLRKEWRIKGKDIEDFMQRA